MSTFGGLMEEYQSISIDRFDGANLNSSVFMLSHNHKDHTVGLSASQFLYKLKNNPEVKLYCSPVTRDLLLLDDCFAAISKAIVPLEVDSPSVIDIPNTKLGKVEKTVTITLLQAGHCPGSVMFLFEGDEGTVLYTGDFRLTKQDIASCQPLHSADGSVKELKSLYADTTFCVPRAFFIPKREDSINATIDIVRDWISRSHAHIILLSYKANLGYEHMFMRLSEEFNMKVHIHQSKYEEYKRIGNLADYMTSDPSQTQIHACKWHSGGQAGSRLPCGYCLVDDFPVEVRKVALSTMCFVQTVGLEACSKRFSETFFRVCYSFHSSYSEIRDMILYLKPDRVFPNVIPAYDDASAAQLQKRLNSFVKLAKRTHHSALQLDGGDLGLLKSPKGRKRKHSSQQSHTSDSLRLIFDEDDKCCSALAAKVTKLDDHLHESSKSDSKDLKSESECCEFPLLFGSQGCNGNSVPVTKSPSLEQEAEDVQNYVEASKNIYADGDSLALDHKRAIAEDSEESDTDAEMRNTAAFVLEPGSLVSYMSEDDSDGPVPPTTSESLHLTAPKSPPPNAPESPMSIAPPLSPSTALESPPAIARESPPPVVSKSPPPISAESQIQIPAKSDLDSHFPKTNDELSVPDEKVKIELKDTIHKVDVEDTRYKVESEDARSEECKIKSPSLPPACEPISNGVQACVDISEETDLSDVIVVDDNSENEAADPVFVWLNGSSSQIHSSRTVDSDITVDVGSSPNKRHQIPATVSLSDVPAVSCECIDLSSDDSLLHSPSEFKKDRTAKVAAWCDKQVVEGDHVAKNPEADSLSDNYEGDDEFEETDKESGYDSDAEIISNRKCTYECVIKERALRFSRTAVNGSDVIVIDDDDVNDAGTNYPRERRCFAPYSSTASSSSSSESSLSTGTPENLLDNEPNCNDSALPQNSNSRLVFLPRSNKPRLWHRQLPPCNADGIKLSSSEDLFSS